MMKIVCDTNAFSLSHDQLNGLAGEMLRASVGPMF